MFLIMFHDIKWTVLEVTVFEEEAKLQNYTREHAV